MLTMNKNAIRLAFSGDWHTPASRFLLGPSYEGYKAIVEIAKAKQVHALGNVGDSRINSNTSRYADQCEMDTLILPLAQAGIGYWVIDGNHDRPGAAHNEITSNSWLSRLKDNDLWKGIHYWNDYSYKRLNINGQYIYMISIPYPPRHYFSLGKELKTKQENDAAASKFIQDQYQKAFMSAQIDRGSRKEAIGVMFHGTIDSPRLQTAGESNMRPGYDVNIPINMFEGADFVATGHVHKHQKIDNAFYTGPLFPQEYDHEGMATGVVIVEILEGKVIAEEFVPVHTVSYKTVEIDVSDKSNPEKNVIDFVKGEILTPDRTFVKVKVKVGVENHFNKSMVREALEELGILDPRIIVDVPEAPSVLEMQKQIIDEIGTSLSGYIEFYMKENPEKKQNILNAGASMTELQEAAAQIEREAFNDKQ